MASARLAALEVGEALKTRRSVRPSHTPARGVVSARLDRGSLGGSAAASSAAAAAPPWVGAGGAAWLARGVIG
jgi:hypothetical protein